MDLSPQSPDPPSDSLALSERVRRLVPAVRGVIGVVQAVGIVSAVSAVVLWAVLFGGVAWPLSAQTLGAVLVLGVLLVPAGGTFLAVLTLREILELPNRLRALPGRLRESATEAAATSGDLVRSGGGRARRALGFFGLLWRLRGVVGDSKGTVARAVALARAARLASLPFVLALFAAFALNFAVIAAAVVAVVVALVL